MSNDVFIQAYAGGSPAPIRVQAIVAVAQPFVIEESPGFALIQTQDGGADFLGYGDDSGLAVVGASGREIWDLVVAITQVTGAAILPAGRPPLVVDLATIQEMPEEMRASAGLVTTGEELMGILGIA